MSEKIVVTGSVKNLKTDGKKLDALGFTAVFCQEMGSLLSGSRRIVPGHSNTYVLNENISIIENRNFIPKNIGESKPEFHKGFEDIHISMGSEIFFALPVGSLALGEYRKQKDVGFLKDSVYRLTAANGTKLESLSDEITQHNFDNQTTMFVKLKPLQFIHIPNGIAHAPKLSDGRGDDWTHNKLVIKFRAGTTISVGRARELIQEFLQERNLCR